MSGSDFPGRRILHFLPPSAAVPSLPTSTDPALAALVAFVRREADPARVVLFGSRASGSERPDSDYDLLVVIDDGADARATMRRLYARKRGLPVSADFVVASEADLERHRASPGYVYAAALRTGDVVYDRDA